MGEKHAKQIQAATRALEKCLNTTDLNEILRCLQSAKLTIQNVENTLYQETKVSNV